MNNPKEEGHSSQAKKKDKPEKTHQIYYCETCEVPCLDLVTLQGHYQGAKHKKMKAMLSGEDVKATQEMETSPESKDKVSERALKHYIFSPTREPLIGIQHVIENSVPDTADPRFFCELCDHRCDLEPLIEHLNSFEHRKAYMAKEYPFLLKVPPAENEDRVTFLRRMALDIERDEGLKMYRSGILKDDALRFLETFEIDSDSEALSIMTLTQNLSESLKTYCLEKASSAKTDDTNASGQVNSLNQPPGQVFGEGVHPSPIQNPQSPFDAQNRIWPQTQFATGGSNMSQGLSQQASYTSGMDSRGLQAIEQNLHQAPINAAQFSFSLDQSHVPSVSFQTNGQFSSGGYRKEHSLYDRGHGPNSAAASLTRSVDDWKPEYQDYKMPGGVDARCESWLEEQTNRSNRDYGARYQTDPGAFSAGLSSNYSGTTSMLPGIHAFQQGVRYGKWYSEPRSTYIRDLPEHPPLEASARRLSDSYSASTGTRMLPSSSLSRSPPHLSNVGRTRDADLVQGATNVLANDILTLIKGKDVKAASKILTTLAPTHPALQKVNIANLLNLLVQTGTIK
ncbi:uncharacterized protein [Pleurodeles waltl]